jgi:DNA-binding PadR family transcriptional regulator
MNMWGSMWTAPWVSHRRRGLRPLVCHLLASGPKTGAEIIDAMERMSQGWWRPSPGSVYPLLEEMTTDKVVRRNADGRYELTESARSQLGRPFGRHSPRGVAEAVQELSSLVAYLEDLKKTEGERFDASVKANLTSSVDRLRPLLE